jgi:hypothetical protein
VPGRREHRPNLSGVVPGVNAKGEIEEWFGACGDIAAQEDAQASVHGHLDELTRFSRAMIAREYRMIEQKQEAGLLNRRLGGQEFHPLDFDRNDDVV